MLLKLVFLRFNELNIKPNMLSTPRILEPYKVRQICLSILVMINIREWSSIELLVILNELGFIESNVSQTSKWVGPHEESYAMHKCGRQKIPSMLTKSKSFIGSHYNSLKVKHLQEDAINQYFLFQKYYYSFYFK